MVSPPTSFTFGMVSRTCSLQHGINVGQKEIIGVAVGGGNFRLEVLEDVEVGEFRVLASFRFSPYSPPQWKVFPSRARGRACPRRERS